MRVLVFLVAVTLTGCSGARKFRSPHVMMVRAVPKVAKRLNGENQAVVPQEPSVEITGNVVPSRIN